MYLKGLRCFTAMVKENFDYIVFINGELRKEFFKISIENVEFLSFNYALNDEKASKDFLRSISIQLP